MQIIEVELRYSEASPRTERRDGLERLKVIGRAPDFRVALRLSDAEAASVHGVRLHRRIIGLLNGNCSSAIHPMEPVHYFTFTPEQQKSLSMSNPKSAADHLLAVARQAYQECLSAT